MHESKVAKLYREVRYTQQLLAIMQQRGIDAIIFYSAAGRTVKIMATRPIMITLEPIESASIKVYMQLGRSKPIIELWRESILTMKLNQLIDALEA